MPVANIGNGVTHLSYQVALGLLIAACGGSSPSASTGLPSEQALDVNLAVCMRSHGVPDFPDPDHHGAFTLSSAVNPQAPQFKNALHACTKVRRPRSLVINQGPG